MYILDGDGGKEKRNRKKGRKGENGKRKERRNTLEAARCGKLDPE